MLHISTEKTDVQIMLPLTLVQRLQTELFMQMYNCHCQEPTPKFWEFSDLL